MVNGITGQVIASVVGGLLLALILYLWRQGRAWGKKVLDRLDLLEHIPSLDLAVLDHENRLRDHGERISTLEGVASTRDGL